MGRGLDGYLIFRALALCSFEGPRRGGLYRFPVAMARGKHLFPFRTEPLSPSAPMVLGSQEPGRVGRRGFLLTGFRPRSATGPGRFAFQPGEGTAVVDRPCPL